MPRYIPVLVVVVALAAASGIGLGLTHGPSSAKAATGALLHNDAGSGQDAGDSPERALDIPSALRKWSANLTPPGTDADWYHIASSGAFCAAAEATTQAPGQITLAASETRAPSVSRAVDPQKVMRLALAAPDTLSPFLGVEPPVMLMGSESSSQPGPGRYTFSLTRYAYADLDPEGDGESPEAGDTLATAVPLPVGCSAGKVSSQAGDLEDRYHFDVDGGREITFSFAVARGDDAELRILTPSGAVHATVRSGEARDVWVSEVGRWSAVVGSPAPTTLASLSAAFPVRGLPGGVDLVETDYLLGVTDGPGDTEPCRPSCVG